MTIYVTNKLTDEDVVINANHIVTIGKGYEQGDGLAVITLSTGGIIVTKESYDEILNQFRSANRPK